MTNEELISQILMHNQAYWVVKRPTISDQEYDALVEEAIARGLDIAKAIGFDENPSSGAGKIKHTIPMLSLDKVHTEADVNKRLKDWLKQSPTKAIRFIVSPKLDGVSCSARYENGKLVYIATRGRGGVEGEDITRHATHIFNIPTQLPAQVDMTIRGEIIWFLKNFNNYKESYGYANPRNATAGLLNTKDPEALKGLGIGFIPFDIVEGHEVLPSLEGLLRIGFSVVVPASTVSEAADVWSVVSRIQANKANYSMGLDGVVVSVEEREFRDSVGCSNTAPKWSFAYKFSDKEYQQSKVTGVSWQVGRTGALTPVIHIDPVPLYGTMVSNVTAHNYERFQALGLKQGAIVQITKGGEIIPYLTGVISQGTGEIMPIPNLCPECQAPLTLTGKELYCVSGGCIRKITAAIQHWCSKSGLDITGVGEVMAYNLATICGCQSPLFLYTLKDEQLQLIPRMGILSRNNLLTQIRLSTRQPIHRLIAAWGIPGIGEVQSKAITAVSQQTHLSGLIFKQSRERYTCFTSLSPSVQEAWGRYWDKFSAGEIDSMLKFLHHMGFDLLVNPQQTQVAATGLTGKLVFITGSFFKKRGPLQKAIEDNGGAVGASPTACNMFLVGSDATPKKQQMVSKAVGCNDLAMCSRVYQGDDGLARFIADYQLKGIS